MVVVRDGIHLHGVKALKVHAEIGQNIVVQISELATFSQIEDD
jgi:hypothetical protein